MTSVLGHTFRMAFTSRQVIKIFIGGVGGLPEPRATRRMPGPMPAAKSWGTETEVVGGTVVSIVPSRKYPEMREAAGLGRDGGFLDRLVAVWSLLPLAVIILAVLGSIYAGFCHAHGRRGCGRCRGGCPARCVAKVGPRAIYTALRRMAEATAFIFLILIGVRYFVPYWQYASAHESPGLSA